MDAETANFGCRHAAGQLQTMNRVPAIGQGLILGSEAGTTNKYLIESFGSVVFLFVRSWPALLGTSVSFIIRQFQPMVEALWVSDTHYGFRILWGDTCGGIREFAVEAF